MGIAALANGSLAVCDTYNHRIKVVKADGTFVRSVAVVEKGLPYQAVELPCGALAVTVFHTPSITIVDLSNAHTTCNTFEGMERRAWIGNGKKGEDLSLPSGVCVLPPTTAVYNIHTL